MTETKRKAGLPDAPPGNWLDRFAPDWLKPYGRLARWDRPIGWLLLMLPCWWSAALAAIAAGHAAPNVWHLALFMVGAIAMRGAGCTYNDIVDRDIDAKVERTRGRPLPSGAVTLPEAVAFLVLQALVGLLVLVQFNAFTIAVGFASLLVVAIYPFLKRVTDWPQLGLGLAFSWGALMGWPATFGSLALAPILLYAASIAWVIGYDTIYAHQDKEDDALIGVRSTARLFGERTKPALAVFFVVFVGLSAAALAAAGAGILAYGGLTAAAAHLAWQVRTLDTSDPVSCLRRFKANHMTGLIFFVGLTLDAALRL
jgi:4-hydroxybenzoate polyprenyltransferase